MNANPAITAAREVARARYEAADTAALDAAITLNRIALVEMLAEADLPAGTLIDVMDWAEEPNGDGTFDVDLSAAWSPDGEEIDDLGGTGAIAAGRYDGEGSTGTDWDVFMADDSGQISVDLVNEWVRTEGWNTPAVG